MQRIVFSALLLVQAFLFSCILCNNVHRRGPRFIRGPYTTTAIHDRVVTSLVPSSCVQVDATLPPCRSVRFLRFPLFVANEPQNTSESNVETKSEPTIHTTELGWGEYLGVFAHTVTTTTTKIHTTVVVDPRIVVTFAVKGCRPNEIPKDLDRCPEITSEVQIQDVLPTSTVPLINASPTQTSPENTKVVNVADARMYAVENIDQIQGNYQNLEGTQEINENHETGMATDPLSL